VNFFFFFFRLGFLKNLHFFACFPAFLEAESEWIAWMSDEISEGSSSNCDLLLLSPPLWLSSSIDRALSIYETFFFSSNGDDC